MLAYEIARHVKPQAVVLIASCRTRRGIRGFFRAAGHIWPVVPAGAFKVAKFISIPALRMFGELMPEHRRLCAQMFSEMDSRFMHWAISAILNWNPTPLVQTPVYQIHGAHDRIIPLKCVDARRNPPPRRPPHKPHPRRRGEYVHPRCYCQSANKVILLLP